MRTIPSEAGLVSVTSHHHDARQGRPYLSTLRLLAGNLTAGRECQSTASGTGHPTRVCHSERQSMMHHPSQLAQEAQHAGLTGQVGGPVCSALALADRLLGHQLSNGGFQRIVLRLLLVLQAADVALALLDHHLRTLHALHTCTPWMSPDEDSTLQ